MPLTDDLRRSMGPLVQTGVINRVTADHSDVGDDLVEVTLHLTTKRRLFDEAVAATLRAHEPLASCAECRQVRCICVPAEAPPWHLAYALQEELGRRPAARPHDASSDLND